MTIKRLIHFWFRSILLLLLVSSFLFVVFFGQIACQHVHGGKGNRVIQVPDRNYTRSIYILLSCR